MRFSPLLKRFIFPIVNLSFTREVTKSGISKNRNTLISLNKGGNWDLKQCYFYVCEKISQLFHSSSKCHILP